jgi:hypothetical protein
MDASYRPIAGQVVMVERAGHDVEDGCLTGVIMPNGDGDIAIDLGRGGPELADGDEVVVSVFSSEAMYRLHGTVHPRGRSLVILDSVRETERVQRRRAPRRPLRMSVTLVSADESDPDVSRVAGRSVDVGVGGLRVETVRPLPAGADPIAILTLPEGPPLMLPTRVVASDVSESGCEYRLAFTQLRPPDADRLAVLMGVGALSA